MTVGEMINRIVAAKRIGEGNCLRDVDPQCADMLNVYFESFGPGSPHYSKASIDYVCNEVERRLAEDAPK